MQSISIAQSVLISREQYRLQRASKVAKTDGQTARKGEDDEIWHSFAFILSLTQQARYCRTATL